jgi:probable HAF family extracellular repeat protein
MRDLGTLGGTDSQANGINDSGQVVGWSADNIGHQRAFLYKDGVMKDLGTLGGGSNSWANGINASGQVVGYSDTSSGDYHAFLYENGVMKDLGTLGGSSSHAMNISASGKVVGWSYTSNGAQHAFIYDASAATPKMEDLNTLIPADSGWTLTSASAINSDGQIAATGHKDGVGTHAFLLSPTSGSPPPTNSDTTAPETSITSGPDNGSHTTSTSATFGFSSNEQGSTFKCQLSKDGAVAQAWAGCTSPKSYSNLTPGNYKFEVRATDPAGNADATPASRNWTITSSSTDTTAPTVKSTVPTADATGVAPTTNVTATFSEDMDASSIYTNTFKLFKKGSTTKIDATVSYPDLDPNSPPNTAILYPTNPLRSGITYKAVVTTGAKDLAGNPLPQQYSWFFTVSK